MRIKKQIREQEKNEMMIHLSLYAQLKLFNDAGVDVKELSGMMINGTFGLQDGDFLLEEGLKCLFDDCFNEMDLEHEEAYILEAIHEQVPFLPEETFIIRDELFQRCLCSTNSEEAAILIKEATKELTAVSFLHCELAILPDKDGIALSFEYIDVPLYHEIVKMILSLKQKIEKLESTKHGIEGLTYGKF